MRAMSAGMPTRPDGWKAWSSGRRTSSSFTLIQPGAMQLTVMWYGANETASEWVSDQIPPLDAA